MNIEKKCLIYSMIDNLFISFLKIIGGFIFGLSSLFADGLHSFSDFITDIFALIGAKISKKRPTKIHPFGFGKIEYVINLCIGLIVVLLGIFIFVNGFKSGKVIPPLTVLVLLFSVIVLKSISVTMLFKNGAKLNSGVLITAAKESMTDIYSSIGVIIVTILLQFTNFFPILIHADLCGSIIIALIVIKTGIPIIKHNIMSLIGQADVSSEHIKCISDVLDNYKRIKEHKIQLIEYGAYYNVHLTLELSPSITLIEINDLLEKIKHDLKKIKEFKIKYINIDVVPRIIKK